ncbi:MAG: type II toxin-antitoxin system HipA family toxin [Acidiferrobacteraceae bacterium]
MTPMITQEEVLEVTTGNRTAGQLRYDHMTHIFRFERHPEAGPAERVSLATALDGAEDLYQTIPPAFAQNLPEGALRALLLRMHTKTRAVDLGESTDPVDEDLFLLGLVGQNLVGRLRCRRAYEHHSLQVPTPIPMDTLLTSPAETLIREVMEKYAPSSGISGVQPKALVPVSRMTVPVGDVIVKTEGPEYPGLAINEYLCLAAARRAGLDTVEAQLSADGRSLIIQRFDRRAGRALGFEDACALFGLLPHGKYTGDYATLIRGLSSFVASAERHAALRTLFRSVAFSLLIGNGDAHLKNFGVLYTDPSGPVALAPLFDVVNTTVYLNHDLPALSLRGVKAWPDRAELLSIGSSLSLTRSESRAILEETTEAIHEAVDRFPSMICGTHPQEHEIKIRVGQAITRHLDQAMAQTQKHRSARPR